ncbi:MAG: chemotaxis-specific protein-glutamate methyltransferase CheB [bacterium]
MAPIRVLVADDSLTIRKHIVELLQSDPSFEVVGEAADGKAVIELCQRLRPDVVSLDMMMPVMTGLAATEYIMAYCPTPILIVSSSTNRGELFKTYDALAAGAVDVIEKPRDLDGGNHWCNELLKALRITSRVKTITHPRARLRDHIDYSNESSNRAQSKSPWRVLAIGASTGGPGAVLNILASLPKTFPIPILLVIHISEAMSPALAEWLDTNCSLPVRFAVDGEHLPPEGKGIVLLAPADVHLKVVGKRLHLSDEPERHSCRPSVDHLFESIAEMIGERAIGCLLTGMGTDGAAGMLAIRQRGGLTVAQDEESSVIFGMPAEAIRLGGAQYVLSLKEISPFLLRCSEPELTIERT